MDGRASGFGMGIWCSGESNNGGMMHRRRNWRWPSKSTGLLLCEATRPHVCVT